MIIERDDPFLTCWSSEKKLNGKSFDELFTIDSFPLWWLYNRTFVPYILPKQINTFDYIAKKKKLSAVSKIRLELAALGIRNMIYFNERRKLAFFNQGKLAVKDKLLSPNKRLSTEDAASQKTEKILFFSYSNHLLANGDVFRVQPLINEIKAKSPFRPLVLFVDTLSSKNYRQLLNQQTIYHYCSPEIQAKASAEAKRLCRQWSSLRDKEKYRLLQKENFSYWPYLKPAFKVFLSKKMLTLLISYYEASKQAMLQESVKALIITSQNSLFDKCIIAAAQKLNVPVLRIQHGIGEGLVPPTRTDQYYKLVFSEEVKKELVSIGWQPEKVIVVGPLIFDELHQFKGNKANGKKNILLATAPLVTECNGKKNYFKRLELVVKSIQQIPGCQSRVKLHPAETNIGSYRKYFKTNGMADIEFYDHNLQRKQFYQLMVWCDVFINFGSTSALEAMIIGRPVVTG